MAAKALARVVRRARACRRIARKARLRPSRQDGLVLWLLQPLCEVVEVTCGRLQRARVHVPLTRAVVGPAGVVEFGQVGHHPRTWTHVRRVVVVARCVRKSRIALGAFAAARDTTGVLDGEHLHARLHPVAELAAVAVEDVIVDELVCGTSAQRPRVSCFGCDSGGLSVCGCSQAHAWHMTAWRSCDDIYVGGQQRWGERTECESKAAERARVHLRRLRTPIVRVAQAFYFACVSGDEKLRSLLGWNHRAGAVHA